MRNFVLLQFILVSQILNAQTNLSCYTVGSPSGPTQYNEIGYYLNNIPIAYGGCQTQPAIQIAVIDSLCIPWDNCNHNFGQANIFIPDSTCPGTGTGKCGNHSDKYFIYKFNSPAQMAGLSTMLSAIPNDHYILAYTWFTDLYSNYPAFITSLQALGATQISTLPDTAPYMFFMKKGNPNSIIELVGNNRTDTLMLNTTLPCTLTSTFDQNDSDKSFSVYPNPANEYFILSPGYENYKWSLSDITGKKVASGKIESDNKINFGTISTAIYILTISDRSHFLKKLVSIK
jgi:hypothetical protein